jgi:glycerol-3-phosphate acyltransferase PlsX
MQTVDVILDAMSGDLGAEPAVQAACQITQEQRIRIQLVGQRPVLETLVKQFRGNPDRLEIIHAPDVIGMEHDPHDILDTLKHSSLSVTIQRLSESPGSTLVTAGNTGALILGAKHFLKKIEGIQKAAFATIFPTQGRDHRSTFGILLDVGATTHCSPEELAQFATMGACYARVLFENPNPKVALLNIGTEPHKGSKTLQETFQLLTRRPGFEFVGNIEGHHLPEGKADVVVTEGLVGNIAVKTAEGLTTKFKEIGKQAFKKNLLWRLGLILLGSGLKKLRKLTDYKEYGGAPLLGFESLCIKAHGRSDAKALKNAIRIAAKASQEHFCLQIRKAILESPRGKGTA